MHKIELIGRLKQFASGGGMSGHAGWRGQRPFARFFADWLERLEIPSDEKYEFWDIRPHLPQLLVDALEVLRTSEDEWVLPHRAAFEGDVGYEVPNVIDVGESYILYQSSTAHTVLGFLMDEILGDGYPGIIEGVMAYCTVQHTALQVRFDRFARLVFRRGLHDLIQECEYRGMDGLFGKTTLRSYVLAGRLMFTFAREIDEHNEHTISFVLDEEDALGLSAGIQSIYTDFRTAFEMIDEVVECWPDDRKDQEVIFRVNDSVTLGGIAAMQSPEGED